MKKYTGKIISLAFPDTFVKYSDEFLVKAFLAVGFGKSNYIKAGHAAFVLIENETGNAEYYDFGRYVTPQGYGRVRSAETDVELEIPFKALLGADQKIENLEEFLLWLEKHPEKTHGSGRLVASVCDYIDYQKAKDFVLSIQEKGSVLYRAFGKEGSNCSRIVADTILAGTDHSKIIKALLRNKSFTPSPLGNVEKSSLGGTIYQVKDGELTVYPGSVLRENLTNYFDKKLPEVSNSDSKNGVDFLLEKAHYLSGIGSGAYFTLKKVDQEVSLFEITRYTEFGVKDFTGLFMEVNNNFDSTKEYQFVYDSNCKYCHIKQGDTIIRFELKRRVFN
ncbi:DUF6695 family protein [Aquimarina pacifica]|uniref:DUF6695 family protein n=1 Tax=Aquimarina pacifica TaxID=1296415 RepID=UPI00046F3FCB|nr:DUF6695 family protein [Aquimarina pacifica]